MFQFLECCQQTRRRPAPAIQTPHQHRIELSAPGGIFPQGDAVHITVGPDEAICKFGERLTATIAKQ